VVRDVSTPPTAIRVAIELSDWLLPERSNGMQILEEADCTLSQFHPGALVIRLSCQFSHAIAPNSLLP